MNNEFYIISKKKKFFFLLIYSLILCVLLFLIFEFILRLRAKSKYGFERTTVDQIYRYDNNLKLKLLIPNLDLEGSETNIKINSLGFRGDEFGFNKKSNNVRIAFLGGSTSFCAEVTNNDSTWPELVGSFLRREFPFLSFQIINGSVPGYGIEDSFINFKYRILPLKPDLVVLYHATNDISFSSRIAAINSGLLNESESFHGSSLLKFLSKNSFLFDLVYKNLVIYLRQNILESSETLKSYPISYSDRFISYLDSVNILCKNNNILISLYTFSTKFRKSQSKDQYIKNMNTSMYYMPWMSPSALFDAFDIFNTRMKNYAEKSKYAYIDTLHNNIPGNDEFFVDSVHFTDRGSRMMAIRVFNALKRENIVEKIIRKRKLEKN